MKNRVGVVVLMSLLVWATIFGSQPAYCGRESGGGGGNGAVAEFTDLARSIPEALRTHLFFRIGGYLPLPEFEEAAAHALVLGTHDRLSLNGVNVTAINYPDQNKIVINFEDWAQLNERTKKQLVVHELIGLKFRGRLDDSNYEFSEEVVKLLEDFTIESAALAVARAGASNGSEMQIMVARTKVLSTRNNGLEERSITEVAIQTFERASETSVRIYHVESGTSQGIISIQLDHFEGNAGGYLGAR